MTDTLNFDVLTGIVESELAPIRDVPSKRLALRKAFYERYGHPELPYGEGFGNSELSFMEWEIRRGVLNPLENDGIPGSAWWRDVNFDFLVVAETAKRIHEEEHVIPDLPLAVQFWIDYIEHPSAENWYRAHNKAIVEGYIKFEHLAAEENSFECCFMNEVLYRVLFAGAMCAGKAFGVLGALFSNPRLPVVDILVHLPDFYPSHYPLSHADIKHVLHKGYSLEEDAVRMMDQWMIMPQLQDMYEWAADYLDTPALTGYIQHHKPIYPSKHGDRS